MGRAADYVLRDFLPYRVFVYAPLEYRKNRIMNNYKDEEEVALLNIEKADKRIAKFYENVSNQSWGKFENYDLLVDSSIGMDKVVEQIYIAIKEKED